MFSGFFSFFVQKRDLQQITDVWRCTGCIKGQHSFVCIFFCSTIITKFPCGWRSMVIFVIILVSKKIIVYFHQHICWYSFTENPRVLAANGVSSWKPGSPIKYCRYGFSAIRSTCSRSKNWNLVWMIRFSNAIRSDLATAWHILLQTHPMRFVQPIWFSSYPDSYWVP